MARRAPSQCLGRPRGSFSASVMRWKFGGGACAGYRRDVLRSVELNGSRHEAKATPRVRRCAARARRTTPPLAAQQHMSSHCACRTASARSPSRDHPFGGSPLAERHGICGGARGRSSRRRWSHLEGGLVEHALGHHEVVELLPAQLAPHLELRAAPLEAVERGDRRLRLRPARHRALHLEDRPDLTAAAVRRERTAPSHAPWSSTSWRTAAPPRFPGNARRRAVRPARGRVDDGRRADRLAHRRAARAEELAAAERRRARARRDDAGVSWRSTSIRCSCSCSIASESTPNGAAPSSRPSRSRKALRKRASCLVS